MSNERDAAVRVIREVIAPLIRADGGRVYLLVGPNNALTLHLSGRYAGCAGNTLARRRVIEPALKAIAPQLDVVITSGALIPPNAELLS